MSWDKQRKKWRVRGGVDGKAKTVGHFANEIKAARAYDTFVIAKKLNKPLNFPDGAAAKGHVVTLSTTSRFRGVGWHKARKKWEVRIRVDGKQKGIGHFTDEIEAAHAYDAYAIANGGDRQTDPSRNFDDEDEDDVLAEAARVRDAPKRRKNASSKSSHFRGVSWPSERRGGR